VLTSVGPGGVGPLAHYRAFGARPRSAEAIAEVTAEMELHRGVNFVCLPVRPAAVVTVENLAGRLGASQIVWTQPDANGRGVFRSWIRGLGRQPAPPLGAAGGYVVVGTSNVQAVVRLQGRPWGNLAYRVDLAPGLNLVGVPKTVAVMRTTAELLALTSARFAVTLAGSGVARRYRVYLPGDVGEPLVAGAGYLLSLARWQRVDLAGFQRLPAELKLGFTGRDGSPDGSLLYVRSRWYRPDLGLFLSQDPLLQDPKTAIDFITEQGSLGANPYVYVGSNPLRWTDPTGERVYVGQHGALLRTGANFFQHRSILLVPDNPNDFGNSPLFQGRRGATLGGQPGGPSIQRETRSGSPQLNLLTLRSAPNFAGDALSGDYVLVETPPGQTDTDFILNLIGASEAYTDRVEYSQFPCPSLGTYNSNSYVAGVIRAAGGTPPTVSGIAPGYDKPLPIRFTPRQSFTPPQPQPHDCPDCRIRNIRWRWNR
ncbi:MAG: hypothetical protein HY343_02160, partial [Lentisphaerae bacterium]|nr:hypothetical protein [Lentisphaerota bacterium]